jgi:hypothetical protein
MDKPLQPAKLEELRTGLRSMRRLIARMNNRALRDTDSLLSVAEAELERAAAKGDADRSDSESSDDT